MTHFYFLKLRTLKYLFPNKFQVLIIVFFRNIIVPKKECPQLSQQLSPFSVSAFENLCRFCLRQSVFCVITPLFQWFRTSLCLPLCEKSNLLSPLALSTKIGAPYTVPKLYRYCTISRSSIE